MAIYPLTPAFKSYQQDLARQQIRARYERSLALLLESVQVYQSLGEIEKAKEVMREYEDKKRALDSF